MHIIVAGPTGVGKTTTAGALWSRLGLQPYLEEVSGNPFLPGFAEPAQNGVSFAVLVPAARDGTARTEHC